MKVLILKPGALGDTLMVVPSLSLLKGGTSVTFVGRRPGIDFLRSAGFACADFEGPGWHRLFMEAPIHEEKPLYHGTALVVAFFSDSDGTMQRNLSSLFPDARIRIYDSLPPEGQKIHAARHLAECLELSGLPLDPGKTIARAREKGLLQDQCGNQARDRLVLHPGSGDPAKNYPPAVWKEIMRSLTNLPGSAGLRPVLLLGPAEEALGGIFPVHSGHKNAEIVSCPGTDDLMELLCQSRLYVGHDSGVTHLAAMLGTPTIALFKSTDPDCWMPLGPRVRSIQETGKFEILYQKIIDSAEILGQSDSARDIR